MKSLRITVRGVVQGVGFRPFIYRLAHEHKLAGWVRNTSGSVEIEVEGEEPSVDRFVFEIASLAPLAVQGIKEVANYSRDHGIQQGLEYVAQRNAAVVPNEDMMEAVSAFLEKRIPRFNGR